MQLLLTAPLARGERTPRSVGADLPEQILCCRRLAACTLVPAAHVLGWAVRMRELSLREAFALVTAQWHRQGELGELSLQTADRFAYLGGGWVRSAAARGVTDLAAVDAALAEDWVFARGRDRTKQVVVAPTAVMHLRRSTLRSFFRVLRALHLTDQDPTLDLVLPPRGVGCTRPVEPDEVAQCQAVSGAYWGDTRQPAALALALASAGTAEIGQITAADLDLDTGRVRLPGTGRSSPRWGSLDPWGVSALRHRVELVARYGSDLDTVGSRPLVYAAHGSAAARQASVCVVLREILDRAGLGAEPDLRPASLAAYPARRAFERTGRIEDAAHVLGLRSLDAAARAIGHNWLDGSRASEPGAER